MCGVFSLLNNNERYNLETIKETFIKGEKRGPEFSELREIDDNLIFGFHRLAVNGLNRKSNQPMKIDGITLVCNGEIYNYKKLYSYLNIEPISDSDCEVIIYLYKNYGIEYTLQLLDGVFSFMLYDINKELLYIARDPYGVRPLYMMNSNGDHNYLPVSFASEVKVLIDLYNKIKKINYEEHRQDYSVKITQFKPGHYMTFKKCNNIFNISTPYTKYNTYCFAPYILKSNKTDLNSIYFDLCDKLISAVKKRVVDTTDRHIACLLSGGLDSSLIAGGLLPAISYSSKGLNNQSLS